MKPTLFQFYIKNSAKLIAFIVGANIASVLLYYFANIEWDKTAVQAVFWAGVVIFIISLVGTMIHYNRTFK